MEDVTERKPGRWIWHRTTSIVSVLLIQSKGSYSVDSTKIWQHLLVLLHLLYETQSNNSLDQVIFMLLNNSKHMLLLHIHENKHKTAVINQPSIYPNNILLKSSHIKPTVNTKYSNPSASPLTMAYSLQNLIMWVLLGTTNMLHSPVFKTTYFTSGSSFPLQGLGWDN